MPKLVTSGLVLYLDAANRESYSGSGNSWRDLGASRFRGTLVNSPTYGQDNCGSIAFNGSTQYANLDSTALGATSDWTISSWVSISSLISTQGNEYVMFSQYSAGSGNGRFLFGLRYDSAGTNNKFGMLLGDRTSPAYSSQLLYGTTTPIVNVPYNVAATRSGNVFSIYVNGNLEMTQTFSSFTVTLLQTTNQLGTAGISGTYFNGKMFSTIVYNKSLTSSEVLQNFNAMRGRFRV